MSMLLKKKGIVANGSVLPAGYTQLKYLESSGHQYIDSGIKPVNETFGLYALYEHAESYSGDSVIIGCHLNSGNTRFWINYFVDNASRSLTFAFGSNAPSGKRPYFEINQKYEIKGNYKNDGNFIIDGTTIATKTDFSGTISSTINNVYLFAGNKMGTPDFYTKGRFYNAQITNGVEVVFNGIPCYRKSDNKPGMYDTVSKTFFVNEGTGEFGYEKLDGTYIQPI